MGNIRRNSVQPHKITRTLEPEIIQGFWFSCSMGLSLRPSSQSPTWDSNSKWALLLGVWLRQSPWHALPRPRQVSCGSNHDPVLGLSFSRIMINRLHRGDVWRSIIPVTAWWIPEVNQKSSDLQGDACVCVKGKKVTLIHFPFKKLVPYRFRRRLYR